MSCLLLNTERERHTDTEGELLGLVVVVVLSPNLTRNSVFLNVKEKESETSDCGGGYGMLHKMYLHK